VGSGEPERSQTDRQFVENWIILRREKQSGFKALWINIGFGRLYSSGEVLFRNRPSTRGGVESGGGVRVRRHYL
jgi:hypothetical protein